jgi:hypothetical protein
MFHAAVFFLAKSTLCEVLPLPYAGAGTASHRPA